MKFSLFFFAANGATASRDKYRLLLDAARFADTHDFHAVWTPERHFEAFGGLYPNPALTSAAIAATTRHIHVRAGSVVLPLHNPVRVAEDWAMIDNLSAGRAGVAVASGWNVNDFSLAPGAFAASKAIMYEGLATVERLWAGGVVRANNGQGEEVDLRIFPRPVQSRLPVWLSGQSRETFVRAGESGYNVLTHFVLRTMPQLADDICAYRAARTKAGHDPRQGAVTVMMHTFVGEDDRTSVATVEHAYSEYLEGYLSFLGRAWVAEGVDGAMSARDRKFLAKRAMQRLVDEHGLVGTVAHCVPILARLEEIGVSEVACLIDFGVPETAALAGLEQLDRLRAMFAGGRGTDAVTREGAG
jgi:natural product biosynthesis luciferase-like monooxygenase protein